MYAYFKRQTIEITHEKTWTWLRKWDLKRETEYHQNKAIRTNYIKAKIYMQQNSKCRLYGDRDKTIYHIIRECSELAQKIKIRLNCVGKAIHLELCRKVDFRNKWFLHNPEFKKMRPTVLSGVLRFKWIN